ncbi:MAG: hypothetical protein HYV96_01650 [Opitutae bacterium]|nr:hypothetical protein [Opitutae bacterium]
MNRAPNPELKPGIDVHKRTTKVNVAATVAVIVFLLVTLSIVFLLARNPSPTVEKQHHQSERP